MNYSNSSQDQIWPDNWMENTSHPSEDNLLIMDDKERLRCFNGNPGYLKKKSKVQPVVQYLRDIVKL